MPGREGERQRWKESGGLFVNESQKTFGCVCAGLGELTHILLKQVRESLLVQLPSVGYSQPCLMKKEGSPSGGGEFR